MSYKVVVIGQGYTGRLSIVRSVASLGCDITLIVLLPRSSFESTKKKKPVDAYSKYVNKVFYSENYNSEMLISVLQNQCVDHSQKTFIFPDNDFSAAVIDNHRCILKAHFYIPHIQDRQGAIEEWMDKVRQKAMAERVGLNVTNAVIVDVAGGHFSIPEKIHYPCFAKPLMSIAGGKSGLKRCDGAKELEDHINSLKIKYHDFSLLCEDYKEIEKEYATLGFSSGEEVIIPGILELLHVGHGSHYGVAVQGSVFPVGGEFKELVEKFKALVKEIGFVGIFDVDFYKSQGTFFFCELNLRFGGSGYAFTKMGVNLPTMLIKHFSGEGIKDMNKAVQRNAVYFNERMAIDDWEAGYISLKELYKLRNDSDIKFVEDEEDVLPQRKLNKEFMIRRIKRPIKKWIGRK